MRVKAPWLCHGGEGALRKPPKNTSTATKKPDQNRVGMVPGVDPAENGFCSKAAVFRPFFLS